MGTGEGVGDESGNIYPTTLKRCGLDMVLELTSTCTCSDKQSIMHHYPVNQSCYCHHY